MAGVVALIGVEQRRCLGGGHAIQYELGKARLNVGVLMHYASGEELFAHGAIFNKLTKGMEAITRISSLPASSRAVRPLK